MAKLFFVITLIWLGSLASWYYDIDPVIQFASLKESVKEIIQEYNPFAEEEIGDIGYPINEFSPSLTATSSVTSIIFGGTTTANMSWQGKYLICRDGVCIEK